MGQRPKHARLSLSYNNISDTNARSLLDCYKNALGSIEALSLPSAIFSGAETTLATFMSSPDLVLTWHFADDSPPKVDSVVPGRSSVTLELIASLDYS